MQSVAHIETLLRRYGTSTGLAVVRYLPILSTTYYSEKVVDRFIGRLYSAKINLDNAKANLESAKTDNLERMNDAAFQQGLLTNLQGDRVVSVCALHRANYLTQIRSLLK